MRENLLNTGMTNHPELGCDKKLNGSCRFTKYVGNPTFLGIKIMNDWRHKCDERTLCLLAYLKELDADSIKKIQEVRWHGGYLNIVLKPLKLSKKDFSSFNAESPDPFTLGNENWFVNWWYSLYISPAFNLPDKEYISGFNIDICGDVWAVFIEVAPNLYGEYITSELWAERSKQYRRKIGCCEMCGSKKRLAVHHRIYPKDFEDDYEENWLCVCKSCHEKIHGHNKKEKNLSTNELEYFNNIVNKGSLFDKEALAFIKTNPKILFYLNDYFFGQHWYYELKRPVIITKKWLLLHEKNIWNQEVGISDEKAYDDIIVHDD